MNGNQKVAYIKGEQRPRLDMAINGQKASCLYDPGTSQSIIRASTMRTFFGNNWQQLGFAKGTFNLRGAGNEILKCIGIYTLAFKLVGH